MLLLFCHLYLATWLLTVRTWKIILQFFFKRREVFFFRIEEGKWLHVKSRCFISWSWRQNRHEGNGGTQVIWFRLLHIFRARLFWGSSGISAENNANYSHAFTMCRLRALKSHYSPALCWQMEKITFLTHRIKKINNKGKKCKPPQAWPFEDSWWNPTPFPELNLNSHHANVNGHCSFF